MTAMVRKLLLLAGLFALIAGALRLGGGELGGSGRVTLTVGFLMLSAHLCGRVLAAASLPLISGYLLAGVLLGPQVMAFVTEEVRSSLGLITQLALGLIALTAGGELRIADLRERGRSIAWVTGLHVCVLFAGAAGVVLLAGQLGGGPLARLNTTEMRSLALVLGLVGVANSPSSAVAVIGEMRARGPLTTLSLGVTVVKDVVVIALMATVIGIVGTWLDPAQTLDAARFGAIGLEILLSLALGALLGAGIMLYLQHVDREVALFLIAVVFVAIELVARIEELAHVHAHFLMLCMTAGFVVENASVRGRTLIRGIERSSLPVYVVFFALVGAGLDLGALRSMWPLALSVCGVRLVLLWWTTRLGARLGGESAVVERWSWTPFVAQAGISLALAELVASRFGTLGDLARTLVLAVVALNQVIGPVFFKVALQRAGEAGKDVDENGSPAIVAG